MALSVEGNSWVLLRACGVVQAQLLARSQPTNHRFPTTEDELSAMITAIRRMGDIVGGTPDNIAAQLTEGVAFEGCSPHDDEGHHRGDRWEQSAGPSDPEVAQRDPVGTFTFGDEKQRDQVARDDEKHLDTEKAPGQPRRVGVVHHDRHHRDGAHPVETGQIRDATDPGVEAGRDRLTVRRGEGRHGGIKYHRPDGRIGVTPSSRL